MLAGVCSAILTSSRYEGRIRSQRKRSASAILGFPDLLQKGWLESLGNVTTGSVAIESTFFVGY